MKTKTKLVLIFLGHGISLFSIVFYPSDFYSNWRLGLLILGVMLSVSVLIVSLVQTKGKTDDRRLVAMRILPSLLACYYIYQSLIRQGLWSLNFISFLAGLYCLVMILSSIFLLFKDSEDD